MPRTWHVGLILQESVSVTQTLRANVYMTINVGLPSSASIGRCVIIDLTAHMINSEFEHVGVTRPRH